MYQPHTINAHGRRYQWCSAAQSGLVYDCLVLTTLWKMKNYAILLRGVMPKGKNRVPMAERRGALNDAGLVGVQSYIQSGNVIAKSDSDQSSIQALAHDAVVRKIGADITVVVRTHEQLKRLMEQNPFPSSVVSRAYYSLLSWPAQRHLSEELTQFDFSPDSVRILRDVIYTLYAIKYSDSKFNNNYFERKLKVPMTARHFNTMSRLVGLSA